MAEDIKAQLLSDPKADELRSLMAGEQKALDKWRYASIALRSALLRELKERGEINFIEWLIVHRVSRAVLGLLRRTQSTAPSSYELDQVLWPLAETMVKTGKSIKRS